MSWLDSSRENLFRSSLEKRDFLKAMKEWDYSGNVHDSESNLQICELCEHPELRYQFEIVNRNNENSLWVGSECIKKFSGVSVLDEDGRVLSTKERATKLNSDKRKLIESAQIKSVLNSLISLSWVDKEFEIESFVKCFEEKNAFTPKQLNLVIWRLEHNKIPFVKKHLKISLKKGKDKEQLLAMEGWKLKKIWDCLSAAQKSWVAQRRDDVTPISKSS